MTRPLNDRQTRVLVHLAKHGGWPRYFSHPPVRPQRAAGWDGAER